MVKRKSKRGGAGRHVSHKEMAVKEVRTKFLLGPYAFANSIGLTAAVFLLAYGVTVWFSDYTGTAIINLFPVPFSFLNWTIVFGLAQAYVFFYIFGWVFVKFYNKTLSSN